MTNKYEDGDLFGGSLLDEEGDLLESERDEAISEDNEDALSAEDVDTRDVSEDEPDTAPEADDEDDAEAVALGDSHPVFPGIDSVMTAPTESSGQLNLASFASHAYLAYAMSVVKSRALPDVSDGQKPVQRRILIDMARLGLFSDKKRVKSARVVGDVLASYHPHGDQSVYDALVRMTQDFTLRYPLIDGQGNFGSRDGDSQAAMRYTEARLHPIASLLLDEVDTGAVDFTPNYDGTQQEPVVLPAKLPMVLLNGSSGIAVGLATEIPSHNLTEVALACEHIINHPDCSLDDILGLMPGPDFPCGGQIISDSATLREIYETGRGKVRVRARYHYEELQRGQWRLVIDELPPDTSVASVLNQIEQITNPKLRNGKKTLTAKQQQAKLALLSILERARDESSQENSLRLVFEPKTSKIDRDTFLNALLAQTQMECNVSMNFVMLGLDGKPRQKPLLDLLREWVEFRLQAVRRRTQHRLDKVNDRIHVLEGRTLALLNLDRVIEIVREADDPKADLMNEFKLTERQADDILEIRLRQLARMVAIAIERELAELMRERDELEKILGSDAVLRRVVVKEIREASKTFGDARRTLIKADEITTNVTTVPDEPMTVILSEKGFIRARTGHGQDEGALTFKAGDQLAQQIECRRVDDLFFMTDTGRCYTIKVSALPTGRTDGMPLSAFIDLDKESQGFVGIWAGDVKRRVILGTTNGMGVLATVDDLKCQLRVGRQFVKLDDGARLTTALTLSENAKQVATLSNVGRLLIFDIDQIPPRPNGGMGVQLMRLVDDETLLAMAEVTEQGLLVQGIGRGQKVRELLIKPKDYEQYTMQRARRGAVVKTPWTLTGLFTPTASVEGIEPLENPDVPLLDA